MIRSATFLLFFVASFFSFGQHALIDNIDGQWCIYRNGNRQLLDPQIHEVGNFDEVGLTYFMRHGEYGILNDNGEIVLDDSCKSIKQLGGGYYVLLKDKKQTLVNWKNDHFVFRPIWDWEKEQANWLIAYQDSTRILINSHGRKEWVLSDSDEIYESGFNYIYGAFEDSVQFLDPNGLSISLEEGGPTFGKDYLLISTPNNKRIIFNSHEIKFPENAARIRVREDEIMYTLAGSTVLISALHGKTIATYPYEDVSYYSNSVLTFRKNGKVGLMKKSGEIVVPPNYNSISMSGEVYLVRTANGAGVIDKNGQQLVPCSYNYVSVYSDFFTVHNDLGLSGVISRKTQKNVLPCAYEKLVMSDSVIRAFASDLLRIIEIDSTHRIVNDLVLSNVTSLVDSRPSVDESVDKRLFPLGWFVDQVPVFDKEGYRTGEELKWGLKGDNDSLLIPARNSEPVYVENADFSLLARSLQEMSIYGGSKGKYTQFEVTSHRTGKRLIPEYVISLDTTDLLSRNYSRFFSSKGLGVLRSDNSILRVNYFDSDDSKYVRYCTSKKTERLPADKSNIDRVAMPFYDLNRQSGNPQKVIIKGKEYSTIRYNNADWNFLDTNGKQLFAEPFNFVEPFKFETAIVLKEGKWGVVRADSMIIPTRFLSLKRSPISDTLFIVQKKGNGIRYLDTNGRIMPKEMSRFHKSLGNLAQIEWNSKKVLVNLNYTIISGETKFQKLMDDDLFYSKESKQFTVYDSDGRQLGEVPLRPEEIWFKEYVLAKSRGKLGVLSMSGDTLIPFEYKKIDRLGEYVFAQDGADNLLYDSRMTLLGNLKSSNLLVDSISGAFAEIKEGKATMRKTDWEKLGTVKGTKFEHYHNGYLVEMGKQFRVCSPDEEWEFPFEAKSFEVMGRNGYLVEGSDGVTHYFDPNWKEVQFEEPLGRVRYVGNGLALARAREYTLLFGGEIEKKLPPNTRNVGQYEGGYLLLEINSQFEFINEQGENHFQRTYKEAHPFVGKYATVEEKDGWTIIDQEGNLQVLPNFDEITAESPTIFATPAQPVYGLYDAHGNELIPAEFQQLNFLRNDIIQGRKNGDIFYFDIHGKTILLD